MNKPFAIVTGGTSGIGYAIAQALVAEGFDVTITGRSAERGQTAAAALGAHFSQVDHSDLEAVRAFAEGLGRVDVLVNNVGGAFWSRSLTTDGHERTLALNLLAPYVLTETLLPRLEEGARVVNIVTKLDAKMHLDLDDPMGERRYRGFDAYAGAKVALLAWTLELADRVRDRGIRVNGVHPGIVMGTSFGADMPWLMRAIGPVAARLMGLARPMEQAVKTPVRLATVGEESGAYLDLDAPLPLPAQVRDPAQVGRILGLCRQLTAQA